MKIVMVNAGANWHLRLFNHNGRIKLAGENYSTRTECRKAAVSLAKAMRVARVVEPERADQHWADGKLAA